MSQEYSQHAAEMGIVESLERRDKEAPHPASAYSALGVGDVVQRGDLLLDACGNYLEMDSLGRMLGVRCLGQTLKRSGVWFRPLKQDSQDNSRQSD